MGEGAICGRPPFLQADAHGKRMSAPPSPNFPNPPGPPSPSWISSLGDRSPNTLRTGGVGGGYARQATKGAEEKPRETHPEGEKVHRGRCAKTEGGSGMSRSRQTKADSRDTHHNRAQMPAAEGRPTQVGESQNHPPPTRPPPPPPLRLTLRGRGLGMGMGGHALHGKHRRQGRRRWSSTYPGPYPPRPARTARREALPFSILSLTAPTWLNRQSRAPEDPAAAGPAPLMAMPPPQARARRR